MPKKERLIMNTDVIALGELLIDFTMNGLSGQGNQLFEANPGGAPCNVLSMLSKLGRSTSFIGKVGNDQFGKLLRGTIEDVGIDSTYLLDDPDIPTTLAFVHTLPDGDRDFSFYRKPGADMMLKPSEIKEEMFEGAKIFHFGTLSMTAPEVRETTLKAVEIAKSNGMIISLDPNLRPPLWDSMGNAREQMLKAISLCDVLKISDNEVQFVSGKDDYDEGIRFIREQFNTKLICLTLGKDGSRAYYKDMRVEVSGFKQENIVDTTGAGDTFCGCVLDFICANGLEDLDEEKLRAMLTFANAAASLVTTKRGAIKSMPDKTEIQKLIEGSI